MKYINKIIVAFGILAMLVSCTEDDKFDGTIEDNNLSKETIVGVVETTSNFALPGQSIDFKVTLPQDFVQLVKDTLDVEATTKTVGGAIRKSTVRFLPGQNIAEGEIIVGTGGGTYFMPVELKLNAIALKNAYPGKHFFIASNIITLGSGDTSVPASSDKQMQIKVAWENTSIGNNIECVIRRVNSVALTLSGRNPSTLNIKVKNINYSLPYTTDLITTATKFVQDHGQTILSNHGITVSSIGKAIIFEAPGILKSDVVVPNPTGFNLSGSAIANIILGNTTAEPEVFDPRYISIYKYQTADVSSQGFEKSTYGLYNPGDYVVSMKAKTLEASLIDLKYRIIVTLPTGEVLIYNDIYSNISTTSESKDILSFTKTDIGENSTFSNIIKL